jgi:DNA repair photolyase
VLFVLLMFLTSDGLIVNFVVNEARTTGLMMRHDAVDFGELAREIDPDALAALDMPDVPDRSGPPARARRGRAVAKLGEPRRSEPEAPASTLRTGLRRGRGATVNPPNRFDAQASVPCEDGWETAASELADLPPLPTTLTRDSSKSVISWNQSPDIGFDRAVNPYRGCEHGCVYCYARPSHAYLGYSPGLDFETKLLFKPDVAELLAKELRKPGYVARTLALGSNTDPYQPVERTLKLTRSVLEVMDRTGHPVSIVTKSAGVVRDLDILRSLAKRNLVRVYLSVTTLDPKLARCMEPRAAAPLRRLQAVSELAAAGVPAGVLAAPMIPGLNDAELERILEASAKAGASSAAYVLLRLPHELKQIFEDWLHTHYPDRARHVLELIRETRSGGLNDARFGKRFSGTGPYADLLASRFDRAARALKLDARQPLDCSQFVPPPDPRAAGRELQMSLF